MGLGFLVDLFVGAEEGGSDAEAAGSAVVGRPEDMRTLWRG